MNQTLSLSDLQMVFAVNEQCQPVTAYIPKQAPAHLRSFDIPDGMEPHISKDKAGKRTLTFVVAQLPPKGICEWITNSAKTVGWKIISVIQEVSISNTIFKIFRVTIICSQHMFYTDNPGTIVQVCRWIRILPTPTNLGDDLYNEITIGDIAACAIVAMVVFKTFLR